MVQSTKHRTLLRLLVLVGLITTLNSIPRLTRAAGFSATDIVSDTNAARTERGLGAVQKNTALTAAAEAKARDMLTRQYFGHVSPTGAQPWSFMTSAGYTFTTAGENLAIDFVDAADVVKAWLASPEHRANLLKTTYRDIGVAVVDGTFNGQSTILVVQFFGSQKLAVSSTPIVTPPPAPKLVTATTPPQAAAPVSQLAPVAPVTTTSTREVVTLNTTWTGRPVTHVAGVATEEVIHSPVMNQAAVASGAVGHPEYALLVIATLGFYLTLVAGLIGYQFSRPLSPVNLTTSTTVA